MSARLLFLLLVALLALGAASPSPVDGSGASPGPEFVSPEPQGLPGVAPDSLPVTDESQVSAITMRIATGLRCPVCQGLSVADSGAEAAVAMRHRIEDLVRLGYGDEQIISYFVDRYGSWVLLEPPMHGRNWLLWAAPFVILAIGGAVLARVLARRRRGAASNDRDALPPAPGGSSTPGGPDDGTRRVLDEMEES
jgi:cytochrome c-type biogenesis protein CcmH